MAVNNRILTLCKVPFVLTIIAGSITASALSQDAKTSQPVNANVDQPVDPCEVVQCYSSEKKHSSDAARRRNISDNFGNSNSFELKKSTNMDKVNVEQEE